MKSQPTDGEKPAASLELAPSATIVDVSQITDAELEAICRDGVPGYDPWREAEGYEFVHWNARHVCEFFPRRLVHVKGPLARKPFELLRWQVAMLGNLYGWRRAGDHDRRRYKELLLYVPKKNGKSALAAGLIHYELDIADYGAELYSAASSLKQASNIWEPFKGMAKLAGMTGPDGYLALYGGSGANHTKSAVWDDKGTTFMCVAARESTADGANPTLCIIDEYHRFERKEMLDFAEIMEKGTVARPDALILYTTTASSPDPGPCNTKWEYAGGVRDGTFDDAGFLPVIFEAGSEDDWESPDTWKKANPSLGATVTHEGIEREYRKARDIPEKRAHFQRFHLNLRTSTDVPWITPELWTVLSRPLAIEDFNGLECHIGCDLSSSEDMTAAVAVFLRQGKYYAFPRYWCPRANLEKHEKKTLAPYKYWASEGHLETEPGTHLTYSGVLGCLKEWTDRFKVLAITFDPRWAGWLMTQVEPLVPEVVQFLQSAANYNPVVEEVERLIGQRALIHDGHPILQWNMSSTVLVEGNTGYRMPGKRRSKGKIDGTVALCMALSQWMARAPRRGSVYEKRGLLDV